MAEELSLSRLIIVDSDGNKRITLGPVESTKGVLGLDISSIFGVQLFDADGEERACLSIKDDGSGAELGLFGKGTMVGENHASLSTSNTSDNATLTLGFKNPDEDFAEQIVQLLAGYISGPHGSLQIRQSNQDSRVVIYKPENNEAPPQLQLKDAEGNTLFEAP